MSLAEDIWTYLQAQGVSGTASQMGFLNDTITIWIKEDGSHRPADRQGQWEHPRVTITARSTNRDTAQALADQIYAAFHRKQQIEAGSRWIAWVEASGKPAALEKDAIGWWRFATDFLIDLAI